MCAFCSLPIAPGSPVDLCEHHVLLVTDWAARDYGKTDLLPSPCLACGSRLGVHYPSGWVCAVCDWRVGELPERDAVPPRVDVVYYLRFGDRVKIGTSANPRTRIATLPHHEVLAFERGDRVLERRRHAQFADHRIPRTEWFEQHEALAAHVAELSEGVSDPWNRYAFWVSRELALAGR
ncbi:MAG: GIY-YIG nuclease family protein [Actinomycetota bacterium]